MLLSWLALSATTAAAWQPEFRRQEPQAPLLPIIPPLQSPGHEPIQPAEHEFTLRHVLHRGTKLYPDLHRRLDIPAGLQAYNNNLEDVDVFRESGLGPYRAQSLGMDIQRLADRDVGRTIAMMTDARRGGYRPTPPVSDWTIDEIAAPNTTDKDTVVSLAYIAAAAYVPSRDDPQWQDYPGSPYNTSLSFGWEGDGLRGYVYADEGNSTIVLSIKGTSKAVFDGADTTTNDKENDNLFFGCCCGQQGSVLLRQVCNCATDTFTCNSTCISEQLKKENRYWRASVELFHNVTELYPDTKNVWVVGHSLGGAVSSLLGLTVGVPAVTFEAPGDALASQRLGLPVPPGMHAAESPHRRSLTGAFHFGHTADPVFTGTCTGSSASCVWGGYALETVCHTGLRCVYDTVKDLGWRNNMVNHGIRGCIAGVYEEYDEPAACVSDADCDADCFQWKYFESNGSEISTTRTSTSTSPSATRTVTCKTPGWWGCLDDDKSTGTGTTTTSMATTTTFTATSTKTLTTTTCKSYGWFGRCLDEVTTTTTFTTTLTSMTVPKATSVETTGSSASSSSVCMTPGQFWGCRDQKTPVETSPAGAGITSGPQLGFELRRA